MVIKMSEQDATSLEEQALRRKERLMQLKRKRQEEKSDKDSGDVPKLPNPIFRSYKPSDKQLQEQALPDSDPANIEAEVKDHLEAAKSRDVIDELDITNLAPRKPDWDLKRDVTKKLEKLERRTQKAIAELIRDRLKQRQEDLATIVNAGSIGTNED